MSVAVPHIGDLRLAARDSEGPDASLTATAESRQFELAARWERLWEHRSTLTRIASRRCASIEDAADVVQETLLRAAAKPDLRLEEAGAWMTRTLVNLCTDLHRRPRHAVLDGLDVPSPRTDFQSPEIQATVRSELSSVARRFAALPARQQQALRLKAEGLPVPEIAAQMQVPYKAVESLLSRARQYLRAGLLAGAGIHAVRRSWGWATTSAPGVVSAAVGAGLLVSVELASPGTAAELRAHGTPGAPAAAPALTSVVTGVQGPSQPYEASEVEPRGPVVVTDLEAVQGDRRKHLGWSAGKAAAPQVAVAVPTRVAAQAVRAERPPARDSAAPLVSATPPREQLAVD